MDNFQQPEGTLQTADLIAKLARVNIRSTLAVLVSLQAVSLVAEMSIDDVLDTVIYDRFKATQEESEACDAAYGLLLEESTRDTVLDDLLCILSQIT